MIEFRGVTKVFGNDEAAVRAVDNLSFSCPRGAFWAIMGPSGSGKSTILHLVAGLLSPTAGHILVEGVDISGLTGDSMAALRRRRIGYIMQTLNLLPHSTVEANVGLPLLLEGHIASDEIRVRAREALTLVNMSHRAEHRPSHLSGGEQQRVAIARALVIKPALILADEPTGNLDQANGRGLLDLIHGLNEKLGVTILMVTHDPIYAAFAQRVLRVVDGTLGQDVDLERRSVAEHPARLE